MISECVLNLFGIDEYGWDSYQIFTIGYLVLDVQDKELRRYVEWALGRFNDRTIRGSLQASESNAA